MDQASEPPPDAPIVCTIQPGDEEEAAMDLYRSLFADAYLSRERTASGVQWTFRDDAGIEARVRALAAVEQACCAFLRITVSVVEGEVRYLAVGSGAARGFLDEYFRLPETVGEGIEGLRDRVATAGLSFDDRR